MNRHLNSTYGKPTFSFEMNGENAEEIYEKIKSTQDIISFKFGDSKLVNGSAGHVDLVKPRWAGNAYEMRGSGYNVDSYLERGGTVKNPGRVEVWKLD